MEKTIHKFRQDRCAKAAATLPAALTAGLSRRSQAKAEARAARPRVSALERRALLGHGVPPTSSFQHHASRLTHLSRRSAAEADHTSKPLWLRASVVQQDIVPFPSLTFHNPLKINASQGESRLVKVNGWRTASPRHFLPISNHPTRPISPITAPVKVRQGWTRLGQHKLDFIFTAKTNPEKNSRNNPCGIAKIKVNQGELSRDFLCKPPRRPAPHPPPARKSQLVNRKSPKNPMNPQKSSLIKADKAGNIQSLGPAESQQIPPKTNQKIFGRIRRTKTHVSFEVKP